MAVHIHISYTDTVPLWSKCCLFWLTSEREVYLSRDSLQAHLDIDLITHLVLLCNKYAGPSWF